MRQAPLVVALAVALAAEAARADTVEASSTTMLTAGPQTRDGLAGQKPDIAHVVPLYEILTLSAREVTNPVADDLSVVLSTWGAIDLGDRRWDAGTNGGRVTGDVMTGYVSGRLLSRTLSIKVGRQYVAQGSARMIQLDGGDAELRLPFGLGVSGYVGSPVSQRFEPRGSQSSWNPQGGDLAYGGRLFYGLPFPGVAGRGFEVGASIAYVDEGKDPVQRNAGFDLRLQPFGNLTVAGYGLYSIYEEHPVEGNASITWTPVRKLHLTADWRYTAPDLFLARNSLLAVFGSEHRNEYGGGASVELGHGLGAGVDYHLVVQPGANDSLYYGDDLVARVTYDRHHWRAGGEFDWLNAYDNGYKGGRVYARRDLDRFFLAGDVLGDWFRDKVNDFGYAISAALTGGCEIGRGFSAVVSGRYATTPFFEHSFDVMAKLVYAATYRAREVY
jgi:hypothetical protein